jgi:hypothetical protein
MARLPNFFIVGAPKAGTTSLYHYLDQHPGIYMSPIKEPNYFSTEVRAEHYTPEARCWIERENRDLQAFLAGPMREKRFGGIVSQWEDYVRLFENATHEPALGEASVCYLWSESAPVRIAEAVPNARILMMLRNPAERAFSQYLHGLGNGAIRWSFREHIQRNRSHRSTQFSLHYPFLEFGLYAEQLERYMKQFGRGVWVGFHEDFRDSPRKVFQSICRFLNVATDFSPQMNRRHLESGVPRGAAIGRLRRMGHWGIVARWTPPKLRPLARRGLLRKPGAVRIEPAERKYLIDFYRSDIRKLEGLVDRDLAAWLRSER